MPEIDLRKIALSCVNFNEFVAKADHAIQKPEEHFKHEEATANIYQIAQECSTFGQFHARMNKQRERGESNV
jgi:hypothetical protein